MVKTKGMTTKYSNSFFSVLEGTTIVNKSPHTYFSINKADTVAILPIDSKGRIILECQFRPAINTVIYEIPAGHIDKGETPHHAALRELEEETGYRAGTLVYMTKIYCSPGLLNEKQYLFLASKLKIGERHLDPMENIKTKAVTVSEAEKMIVHKKINDAKTITAILYLKAFSDSFK